MNTRRNYGSIKWFDASGRGFGFIRPDSPSETDAFVHIRDVRKSNIDPDTLKPGDRVSFLVNGDRMGREMATDIELLSDSAG